MLHIYGKFAGTAFVIEWHEVALQDEKQGNLNFICMEVWTYIPSWIFVIIVIDWNNSFVDSFFFTMKRRK